MKIMKSEGIILSVLIFFLIFNFTNVNATQTEVDELLKNAYEIALMQNYEEAIIIYDKILEIDPTNTKGLSYKAASLAAIGELSDALVLVNKALEIDPENVDALNNKGMILGMMKNYEEALIYLDKVIEIDPENVNALNNKGAALTSLNRYEEALIYLQKAINIDPNISQPLNNKFLVFQSIDLELIHALAQTVIRDSDGNLVAYLETDRIFQKKIESFKELFLGGNRIIDASIVMRDQELFYLFEFETIYISESDKMVGSVHYFLMNPDNQNLNFNALVARYNAIMIGEGYEVTTLWKIIIPV